MGRVWLGDREYTLAPVAVEDERVDEPLPQRTPGAHADERLLATQQLPVVRAVRGPAALFDPDAPAPAVDPAGHSAAAVELAGDELADELAEREALLEHPGWRWFEPAVPGALYEQGSQVPPPALLTAAARELSARGLHDVAAWCDTWAAAAR